MKSNLFATPKERRENAKMARKEAEKNCYQMDDFSSLDKFGKVVPVCRACLSEMEDFKRDFTDSRPRFICKNSLCRKRLVKKPNSHFLFFEFIDSNFKTAVWNISDLANAIEYKIKEKENKITQFFDEK